ncbi:hypothetical protein COCC4DRAFT_38529, partial [Bipolaris maydis ATCC 48331]
WDERFDHIAEHLEQDNNKKSIEEWICVEQNKTKKELLEERMRNDDEDEERGKNNEFASVGGEGDSDNPLPPPPPPLEHGPWTPTSTGASLSQSLPPYSGNEGNRKRSAPNNAGDLDPRSKQKRRMNTFSTRAPVKVDHATHFNLHA